MNRNSVKQWDRFEVELEGPATGNPFAEVELSATFTCGDTSLSVDGFYDGEGKYRVRCMPSLQGTWEYEITSNADELSNKKGRFECVAPDNNVHGPVRVAGPFEFEYADGTRFLPIGTTAYAWIHQSSERIEETIASLSTSPFTKIRMMIFPKHYDYNKVDPDLYAFPKNDDGTFDHSRFSPEYFAHLEACVNRLEKMGIEADLILFHPYDRWGFAEMNSETDDAYLRYIVARMASFRNVWWSFANEYDLMKAKSLEDWERFLKIVAEKDPYHHLRSIHNCRPGDMFDHNHPLIDHVSLQYQEGDAGKVAKWCREFGKPLCLDECGYEGTIQHGWGNLTGEELICRSWEAAASGGYAAGHSETLYDKSEVLWWSHGGKLKGESVPRFAFMRKVLEQAPKGIEYNSKYGAWDCFGVASRNEDYIFIHFGRKRPCIRFISLPEAKKYKVEIFDMWNMTIEEQPETVSGDVRIELPGRPLCGIRLTAV